MKRFRTLLAFAIVFLLAACVHAADTRADFLKLIEHPQVPLKPEVKELLTTNGIQEFYFSFASDVEQRVPGILVKSVGSHGRRPVVIALHGTGGSKTNMLPLCLRLATNGFIAIAIDGRYHGERTKAGKGSAEYQDAIVRAWQGSHEHPFFYDTVWDVMRLVDYLETRDDVDAKHIGLIGISKGGVETYLAAAADKRIVAAVPCIGVQSFRWALDNNQWQGRIGTIQGAFDAIAKEAGMTNADSAFVRKFYDRVAPGIYNEFDGPAMLPLIAPRALLVINSDSDNHTPLPGVNESVETARMAYHANGADHFAVRIQKNTAHKVTPESETAAVEWFRQWLRP